MAGTTIDNAAQEIRDMFHKGMGAMERGNYDFAISMFFACLDREPTLTDIRKFLYVAEIRKFSAEKHGSLVNALSTLAGAPFLIRAAMSPPMKALRMIENLLKDAPLNMPFITRYCKTAEAAGMPEVAIQILATAREHFPNDAHLISWLGDLHLKAMEPSEARECYEKVHALKPQDGRILKKLKDAMAEESLTKDGWDDAGKERNDFRKLIKDTKQAQLLEQEAKAVRSESDTDALIDDTKTKIQRDPGNVNLYRQLSNLLTTQKQFDEAVAVLTQAQELRGSADPEIDASISATTLKKYDNQIAELSASGDLAGAEDLRKLRGEFFINDIQRRVGKYPNDLNLRYDFGVLLYGRGMFNEAIQQFQLAQRNPRWHTKALFHLGKCFKDKKQYDLAIEQFEKAASELLSMDSTKKDIFYELGMIKESMNDMAGAQQYYKEIYQVDIGYKDIARKVEQGYRK